MLKSISLRLVLLTLLSSCIPDSITTNSTTSYRTTTSYVSSNTIIRPTTSNVRINSNYTLYYDYYAYVIGGINYDAYWPKLTITNTSSSYATISFKYSFYVCGYRQTSTSLNKTVNYFAPKGTSYWEMSENDSLVIPSTNTCNGSVITASNVDFDWTVISVY